MGSPTSTASFWLRRTLRMFFTSHSTVGDAMYEGWYKGTTLLPVTKSMIEKGKSEGDEYQKKFLEALSFVKFQPVSNPQWDALQGALQTSAYKVGEQEPEALLQEIQALVAASA